MNSTRILWISWFALFSLSSGVWSVKRQIFVMNGQRNQRFLKHVEFIIHFFSLSRPQRLKGERICYIAGFKSLSNGDFIKKTHTRGWRRVAFDWMLAWRLPPKQWVKYVFAQEAPRRASGRECKKLIQFNKIPFFSQS